MGRDKDRLLVAILLGTLDAGVMALVIVVPLTTEIRQTLMIVAGMLLVAAFSALSRYVETDRSLRIAALPGSPDHRFLTGASAGERASEPGSAPSRDRRPVEAEGELDLTLRRLAAAHGMATDSPPMPLIALAARLRERGVIAEAVFRRLADIAEARSRVAAGQDPDPETTDRLRHAIQALVAELDAVSHSTKVTS